MDEDSIIIQIELRKFAQSVKQIKQVADEVKKMGTSSTRQARADTQATAAFQRDLRLRKNSINQMHRDEAKVQSEKDNAFKAQMTSNAAAARQQQRIQTAQDAASAKAFNQAGAQIRKQQALANKPLTLGRFSPAQRLQRQMGVLKSAIASGDPQRIFDAQYGAHSLHQRVQQAKNFMNPMSIQARNIQNAIAPARALMSAIGEVATPVMAFGGAVIAAVVAVGLLAKAAIDAGVAFAKIGLTAGGTGEQSALLNLFGKTVGADLAGPAREFADAISKGGAASGFAARAGIFHHGTFDTTNVAEKYLRGIEYMRKLPRDEALRMARTIPGLEASAGLLNVSEGQFGKMKGDVGVQNRIFTPQFQQDTADFMSALARLSAAFQNLMAAVIKPFMPALIKLFNDLADWVNGMAEWANSNQNIIKGVGEIFKGLLESISDPAKGMADIAKGIKDINTPTSKTDPLIDALNRNAHAVDRNTDSYAQNNGTYGGGERARGAIPSKWSGVNSERWLQDARKMGAFAL